MDIIQAVFTRTQTHELELILRFVAALVLGGLLGWEREANKRPAGLRTHMLTSLAAAVFTVVALELVQWAERRDAPADPVRAIEAVTAGVAFLAAGTIIQSRGHVTGLTTGASMWLAGAIGAAAGSGLYTVALFVALLAFVVLAGLQRLSARIGSADE